MGFKALKVNKEYISFEIIEEKWQKFKSNKEFKSDLVMPCCKQKAVMKNSALGLQFFSHSPHQKKCDAKGESSIHLQLKKYIYDLLTNTYGVKNNNRTFYSNTVIDIEKTIQFDDYYLRADVYLEIDDIKIAFEIQSSKQTFETTIKRTKKYTDNGIIVVWLNLFKIKNYDYYNFNKKNDLAKMYEVVNKDDRYYLYDYNDKKTIFTSYNKFILDRFILDSIDFTINGKINDFIQSIDKFIEDKYYSYYELSIDKTINDIKYFIKGEKRILRLEKSFNKEIEIFLFKGFVNKSFATTLKIEKKPEKLKKIVSKQLYNSYTPQNEHNNEYLERNANEDVLSNVNRDKIKSNCRSTIVSALKANNWTYELNKIIGFNRVDIIAEFERMKVAFILFFNTGNHTTDLLKYCEDLGMGVVVINFHSGFNKCSRRMTFLNYYSPTRYAASNMKDKSFFETINKLIKKSMEIPKKELNSINIEDFINKRDNYYFFDPDVYDNFIFDKEALKDFPRLMFKEIKEDIFFTCYYIHGILKYQSTLIFEYEKFKNLEY